MHPHIHRSTTPVAPPPRRCRTLARAGALVLLALLLGGLTACAAVPVAAPTAPLVAPQILAQASACSDWDGCIDVVTDGIRKLWVLVVIAEALAALTYFLFFFLGTWFPGLMAPFQGDWVKKAVLIGVLAHPVLLALLGAVESSKSGLGG